MRRATCWLVVLGVLLAGCLSDGGPTRGDPGTTDPGATVELPGAEITTPHGTITLVLYPEVAPETVGQFSDLVRTGWYNGTTFYRTVDDFVIQGGPQDDREPADTVPLEPGAHFAAGTLGLARDLEEDSGTSHFFATEYPQEHLHDPEPRQSPAGTVYGRFTAFGQVVAGMDVVRTIAELPQEEIAPGVDDPTSDRPQDPPPMVVRSVTVALSAAEAEELPYRTWGRERAPPYRLSVDSPGTLPAQSPTWLRVFVEEEADQGPRLEPTFVIHDAQGDPVGVQAEPLAGDPDVHRIEVTFPHAGSYVLTVGDGSRQLASFDLQVEQA